MKRAIELLQLGKYVSALLKEAARESARYISCEKRSRVARPDDLRTLNSAHSQTKKSHVDREFTAAAAHDRSVTSKSRAERREKADRPAAAGLTGDAAVPNNGRVPQRVVPSRPPGVDGVPPFDLAASQRGCCPRTGCTSDAQGHASFSIGQKREASTHVIAKSITHPLDAAAP